MFEPLRFGYISVDAGVRASTQLSAPLARKCPTKPVRPAYWFCSQ